MEEPRLVSNVVIHTVKLRSMQIKEVLLNAVRPGSWIDLKHLAQNENGCWMNLKTKTEICKGTLRGLFHLRPMFTSMSLLSQVLTLVAFQECDRPMNPLTYPC